VVLPQRLLRESRMELDLVQGGGDVRLVGKALEMLDLEV
jgi:hypothetical protein